MSDVDIKRMARRVERGQGLTANAKRNLWMVTLLNPQQNGVPAGLTPDECAEWALKHWCLNESGGLRKSRGALVAYEIAPTTGTPHLQMLMCATNSGCTAERVLKAWPAADIEVVRDFSGAVDYIYKRGEYADKAFTQIVPARAMDNELVPNPQRSRRNKEKTLTHDSKRRLVWSAVFEDGMTAAQIYADPELAVYASGMDIVLDRWIRERDGSQPRPEIHVLWLQGELSSLSLLSAVRSELSKRFGAAWGSGLWVTLHSRSFRAIRVLLWLACLARWNVRRLTLICPSSAISRRCRFVEPISRLSGLVGSLR